jgi:hypothetical protein
MFLPSRCLATIGVCTDTEPGERSMKYAVETSSEAVIYTYLKEFARMSIADRTMDLLV